MQGLETFRNPNTGREYSRIDFIDIMAYSRLYKDKRHLNEGQIILIHQYINRIAPLPENVWLKLDYVKKVITESKWEKPRIIYDWETRELNISI